MAGFPFVDPVSGQACTLKVDFEAMTAGVKHPDCDHLADVTIGLDCFYCQTCKWNGRISGAWVCDLIDQRPIPVDDRAELAADMATAHTEDTSALVVGFTSTAGTGVLIHSVPAVSIDGRTIVILRDDQDEPDEDGLPAGWWTLDSGEQGGSWWSTAADIRAHATELAEDPGMVANFPADLDLWATVAALVEKAEQD